MCLINGHGVNKVTHSIDGDDDGGPCESTTIIALPWIIAAVALFPGLSDWWWWLSHWPYSLGTRCDQYLSAPSGPDKIIV